MAKDFDILQNFSKCLIDNLDGTFSLRIFDSGPGTPPGGSDGQIQFNNGGAFDGIVGSLVDSVSGNIALGGSPLTSSVINVYGISTFEDRSLSNPAVVATNSDSSLFATLADSDGGAAGTFYSSGAYVRLAVKATSTAIEATGQSLFSYGASNQSPVTISGDWDNDNTAQLRIRGFSNNDKELSLGYDTDNDDVGRIQAIDRNGDIPKPLILNFAGGNVGVGINPTWNLDVSGVIKASTALYIGGDGIGYQLWAENPSSGDSYGRINSATANVGFDLTAAQSSSNGWAAIRFAGQGSWLGTVGFDIDDKFKIDIGTFVVGGSTALLIDTNKNIGIGGVTSPTARLHIAAGSATASTAPFKFNSGTLLTTAEAGALEFLTDKFYGTITTGAARKEITLNDAALTSGRVPFSTTNGRLTDDADFTFSTDTLTVTKFGATTLTGTIAGGGNQINNVIIGTTTPLAGSFTTVVASTSVSTPSIITASGSLTITPAAASNVAIALSTTGVMTITSSGTNFEGMLTLKNTANAAGSLTSCLWHNSAGTLQAQSVFVDSNYTNASLRNTFITGTIANIPILYYTNNLQRGQVTAAGAFQFGSTNQLVISTAGALSTSGSITTSTLTAGRVVIAGTAGVLADDADFTFATDTLTVTGLVVGTTKLTSFNGIATQGLGAEIVYKVGRATAQTAANTSVVTYTTPAADGSYIVSANVLVTTSTLHNFTATVDYTDEGNTARVLTLNFQILAGTIATAIANAAGAVPYEGIPVHLRTKASTAITVKTAGTFTTVTYNVEGIIRQLA